MSVVKRQAEEERERKRAKRKTKEEPAWQGYIELTLTDDDRERISELGEEFSENHYLRLEQMVEEQYKVSIRCDVVHNCYICTATGLAENECNAGWSLTARAGSMELAIAALWWKIFEVAQGGVWANVAKARLTANGSRIE